MVPIDETQNITSIPPQESSFYKGLLCLLIVFNVLPGNVPIENVAGGYAQLLVCVNFKWPNALFKK